MPDVSLPHDARAGPTKPAVRAVLLDRLDLGPDDHFVEVGPCTGAVTIEAARAAGRVTAVERKTERLDVARKNLAANGIAAVCADLEGSDLDDSAADDADEPAIDDADDSAADVELRADEAPSGLPDDADALFLGGSRNYEAVLDHAVATAVDRVVMNVSRLEVAGAATEAFRERGLLEDVLQLQVSHGYELAGATSFDSENPVYMLVGSATAEDEAGAEGEGERRSDDEQVAADGGSSTVDDGGDRR